MKRRLKLISASLAVLLVLATAGFYTWTRASTYPAFPEAAALAAQAQSERGWYVFAPDAPPRAGYIFYPGGLVDPAAYSPLMQQLSDDGVLAIIVPMPLNLAVFDMKAARDVVVAYPDIDTWILGGHSLGGAMAAEYLKTGPVDIDGMALIASYPAESTDLSAIPVSAVSIYGTEDGVTGDVFQASLPRLPEGTSLVRIEGGNHAQFGNYGPQKGDGVATISRAEQQRLTVNAILGLAEGLE
jgi:dienelactone hydrolase